MDAPDKFTELVRQSEYSVAILANLDTNDTQFVALEAVPTDMARTYAGRGLAFIGVVGTVNGTPRVALAVELADSEIAVITQAFVAHVRKQARWTVPVDRNVN